MTKRKFRPYRLPGRESYTVTFWHPLLKKQITRGLATRDPAEAEIICTDLHLLCEDPAFWKENSAILRVFHPRARDAFYNARPDGYPGLPRAPRKASDLERFTRVSRLIEQLKTVECDCVYQRIVGKDPDVQAALFWAWPGFHFLQLISGKLEKEDRGDYMEALLLIMKVWAGSIRAATRERKNLEAQLRLIVPKVPTRKPKRKKRKR